MPRSRSSAVGVALAGLGLAISALAIPTAALEQDDGERIDLPPGWRPEGITALGDSLFVGSLADGAIWKVPPSDPAAGSVFVPGVEGRITVGVEATPDGSAIWAAGGPTGQVRAHSVADGSERTWMLDGTGFLNDIAATETNVYVTDSFVPQLFVFDLADADAEPTRLRLHGDLQYVDRAFNVNGIIAAPASLVVVQSQPGGLFRVDPVTGETFAIATDGINLAGGDGLELDGEILYVTRNSADRVMVLRLDEALTAATLETRLVHDDLDTPTTSAIVGDDLWVVNARFGEAAGPETAYWLTRFDAQVAGAVEGSGAVDGEAEQPTYS